MMKAVKFRALAAGPAGVFQPGTVAAVDDRFADALVETGFAEFVPVFQPPEPEPPEPEEDAGSAEWETATADPPESAMQPKPRRRKAG